jgi:hypothetical protein
MARLWRLVIGMALLSGAAGCASTQPPPTIDITGKWQGTWVSANQPAGGNGQIEMTVTQTGSRFAGNILVTGSGTDPSGLTEGFVTGNQVEVTVPAGLTGRLTLNGDELTGRLAGISGYIVTMRRQK